MTTIGFIIILIAVALAAGMAVVTARVMRDERRRSDARVAALARMAGGGEDGEGGSPDFLPEPGPGAPAAADPAGGPPDLFAGAGRPSAHAPRLLIGGALALVVLIAGLAAMLGSPSAQESGDAAGPAAEASAPLELLALGHTQAPGALTVTGTVQSPRGAPPASSLTATVFLFGGDGAFLTSGRAPVGAASPGANGRSTFVVTVPVTGRVARYRVSFRDSTGRAVAHLDRRSDASVARNE